MITPQLSRGINLDLDLESKAKAEDDRSLNIHLKIAPNTHERDVNVEVDFTGHTPIIGAHKVAETVGSNRESHHVPEKQLAVVLKVHYGDIANALNGKDGFEEVQQACQERKENIETNYLPSHGKNLSAILISHHAHKASPNAVHRVNTN